jgi:hypothetical protein
MTKGVIRIPHDQTERVERPLRRALLCGVVALATVAGGVPAGLPGSTQAGTLDNPIPAGDLVEYKWGTMRILSFHRPTAFQVGLDDLEGSGTESRLARPATGAEFVSIELEFTCAATETTCEGPPEAMLELVLADGRMVEEKVMPMTEAWMGEEEVAGGSTVSGWITFEVPGGTTVQALKITLFKDSDAILDTSSAVHAALPEPVDGYTI